MTDSSTPPGSGFELTADCAVCKTTSAVCEYTDGGCCDGCRATGGCTHDASSCGAEHPTNSSVIPCNRHRPGMHVSTTGCAGSVVEWPEDVGLVLSAEERGRVHLALDHGPETCDCSAYAPENDYAGDSVCEPFADGIGVIQRIVAARVEAARAEGLAEHGTTVTHWRINGPDGPSYAIDSGDPEAEHWSRKVAALTTGRYVERRDVTTYPTRVTDWVPAARIARTPTRAAGDDTGGER